VNYPLRHTVTTPADPGAPQEYDEYGDPIPAASIETYLDFEVQLEPRDDGNAQARLGVDPTEVDVNGLVTKTAWSTLTLPEGAGAGSSFKVTFRAKSGVLTIGAAPDDQHPKTVNKIGEEFRARWRSS